MKINNISIFFGIVFLLMIASVSASVSASVKVSDDNGNVLVTKPVVDNKWGFERVDYIHYKNSAKPARPAPGVKCYKLMGVKWPDNKLPVSYVINPNNPQGLTQDLITSEISTSAETWDLATPRSLFNYLGVDSSAQYGIPNFQNAIAFGNYPTNGVIAVTSVWYNRAKQIVEFDMMFDTDFVWGDVDTTPGVMDLQNIATHELGHAVGLSDLYTQTCSQVTMYGYSWEGDVAKRTLEPADITGLLNIYP